MNLFRVLGLVIALGLGLALWESCKRAERPDARWTDKAASWFLAFATTWVLIAAIAGVR